MKSNQSLHGTKPYCSTRTHKEKKKVFPRRHPSCCSIVFSCFPSLELLFPLLLSAENGAFRYHSELSSPQPSLGCALVTSAAGVGPIKSQLPIGLLSWIECCNYTLPGYFTQIHRQDFLCMFLLFPPVPTLNSSPQDTWEIAFYS